MKKIGIVKLNQLFLYGFILLLFAGCTNSSNNKVGMLIHQLDGRWKIDVEILQEGFKQEGIEFILKDAMGDENLQLQQAEDLINEGVDAIIIVAVNQNTAAGVVRSANDNNIPVIGYDRMVNNCDLDYYLSFDYEQIGTLISDYALSKMPKGNYVLIWGDAFDANARAIQKAQLKALQPSVDNGNIHLVYRTFVDKWNDINSKQMMDKILDFTTDHIDAVLVSNDVMAIGVIKSLEEHNLLENTMVTGHDATPDGRKLIEDGQLMMTVFKPINELAGHAIDLVVDVLNGKKVETNTTIFNGRKDVDAVLLPAKAMDKTNLYSLD